MWNVAPQVCDKVLKGQPNESEDLTIYYEGMNLVFADSSMQWTVINNKVKANSNKINF